MKKMLAWTDFTSKLLYNAREQFQQFPQKRQKLRRKNMCQNTMKCHA